MIVALLLHLAVQADMATPSPTFSGGVLFGGGFTVPPYPALGITAFGNVDFDTFAARIDATLDADFGIIAASPTVIVTNVAAHMGRRWQFGDAFAVHAFGGLALGLLTSSVEDAPTPYATDPAAGIAALGGASFRLLPFLELRAEVRATGQVVLPRRFPFALCSVAVGPAFVF